MLEFSGYCEHRIDRDGRGSGVLVYVPDNVKSMRRQDLEVVWIQLKTKSGMF